MASLSPAEQLLFSTVHIGSESQSAAFHGTGFYYSIEIPNQGSIPLLITNKHVIQGCDRLTIHMHRADSDGAPAGWDRVTIGITSAGGIAHHPDPTVDLCAISVDLGALENQGFRSFAVNLDKSLIPTEQEWENLDALEQVLMIGCPNGLYDQANNLPIFRRGITASHPAKKFNGLDEFLIDAACFPGSSGSPVFLYDQFGYRDKISNNYIMGAPRIKLLGVLYAGPTIEQDGRVTLSQTPRITFNNMMHLGQVIRSTRLLELDTFIVEKFKTQSTGQN